MKLFIKPSVLVLFMVCTSLAAEEPGAAPSDSDALPVSCPIDAIVAADRLPMHKAQTNAAVGKWRVTDEALSYKYFNVPRENFMGYTMRLGLNKEIFIGDLYYEIGDIFGHQAIPLADHPETLSDGRPGYAEIDAFLREVMRLDADDEIFSYITYNHPEYFSGTLQSAESDLLTEGRQTHSGAYIGKGRTRNSPMMYHERGFAANGYPLTFQLLVIKGMDQATLNLNSVQWMEILNDGVLFPMDYKKDPVATPTLASIVEFARTWVVDKDALDNFEMATYCAEHQNMHANLTANIPLNKTFFESVPGLGADMWTNVKSAYEEATGETLVEVDLEKYGLPLFQRAGLDSPLQARDIGQAMVWPPAATSDLVVNYIEAYLPFIEAGGVTDAAAILGFKSTVQQRMDLRPENLRENLGLDPGDELPTLISGFDDDLFNAVAVPVINIIQVADALTRDLLTDDDIDAFVSERMFDLASAFGIPRGMDTPEGGVSMVTSEGELNEALLGQIPRDMQAQIQSAWKMAGASVGAFRNEEIRSLVKACNVERDVAWTWLRKDISPILAAVRRTNVSDDAGEGIVRWNFPPAIFHRAATGMHPSHPDVRIVEVAHGQQADELERVPGQDYVVPSLEWK